MAKGKALVVHDPYRNIDTTLAEFAKAEGVPKYTTSHYYWVHKSLDGFRDRPIKGRKACTYSFKGMPITCKDAVRMAKMRSTTLKLCREKYLTSDIEEIMRLRTAELKLRRQKFHSAKQYETDDGRRMTIAEFAHEAGATFGAVSIWVWRKGSFKGFMKRGYSRIKPKMYPHSGLKISKSVKEWAQYYNCSKKNIKLWVRKHGIDMAEFENRKKRIRRKR